jgi:deoxyadenosine/deoxycytidine kinase
MEETISLDYLQKCHHYHDKWMQQIWSEDRSCITIDANVDMNMNPETIQEWVDIVKKMVRHDYIDL